MERARLARPKPGGNYFGSPKDDVLFIPSGSKLLDLDLGGGWARDKIVNIVGDRSTGKTLLAIEMSANFCRTFPTGQVDYREAEAAFLPDYAGALGMPLDRVRFGKRQLETVEDLFEDLTLVVRRPVRGPRLYILDSLDALSDRAELERAMDKGSYGSQKAKNMSQLFRRLTRQLVEAKVTLVIISQIRDKIGMSFTPHERSGGRALDFYASQIVWLHHRGPVKRTLKGIERVVGVDIHFKVTKNKVGLPFREDDFSILFGYGIDDLQSCCHFLKQTKGLSLAGLTQDYKAEIRHAQRNGGLTKLTRKVQEAVQAKWWEVEKGFLPQRGKYEGN